MQRVGSALGVAAAGASSAAGGTQGDAAISLPLEPWRQCWSNRVVADVCCNGAWGGTGCWEEHRSFDTCCWSAVSRAARAADGPRKQQEPCGSRLSRIATALGTEVVLQRLVKPTQEQAAQHLQLLTNSTTSGRRFVLPFLAGPSVLERKAMLELTALVMTALERQGITYWAHGVTLLGALQHYGPIPWEERVELAAFAGSVEDVLAALEAATAATSASAFGPVLVTPTASPACGGTCGHWVVSFSNGIAYTGGKSGQHAPVVEVDWLDPRGESPAWKRCYNVSPRAKKGAYSRLTHYDVLGLILPLVQGRPFAHLRLPIPRHSWRLMGHIAEKKNERLLQVCRLQGARSDAWRGTVPQLAAGSLGGVAGSETLMLPCATLTSVFPMVLYWRNFETPTKLLAELGADPVRPSSTAQARAAVAAGGKLTLSVEIALDAMRGAHVLLVAHEEGGAAGGMCWSRIYGEHDLITEVDDKSSSSSSPLQ